MLSRRNPQLNAHGELHRRGPAVVEQLVDHRADGAAAGQHVVDQQDARAVDLERQLGGRLDAAEAALAEVVAVQRAGDGADRPVRLEVGVEALRQPGAARPDAHEHGVGRQQPVDAELELAVQLLRIQQKVGH